MKNIFKKIIRKRSSRKLLEYEYKDLLSEANNYNTKNTTNMLIIVGAESTATRYLADKLSEHPQINGKKQIGHQDLLDTVWQHLEKKNYKDAYDALPNPNDNNTHQTSNCHKIILTRRSIPHAPQPGTPAQPYEFPPLKDFLTLALKKGFVPTVFVTVRSPLPNLFSWTSQRNSAQKSFISAYNQYQKVYPYIFDTLSTLNVSYFIVPHEALSLDGVNTFQSLFFLIGLEKTNIKIRAKNKMNKKYLRRLIQGQ